MKKLLKKEIFGSHEQCMGPTGVTYSVQNLHFQRGSGSHAQCTGPTGRFVTPTFTCFSNYFFKKKLKEKTQTRGQCFLALSKDTLNKMLSIKCPRESVFPFKFEVECHFPPNLKGGNAITPKLNNVFFFYTSPKNENKKIVGAQKSLLQFSITKIQKGVMIFIYIKKIISPTNA